jgi:hypothetical protein
MLGRRRDGALQHGRESGLGEALRCQYRRREPRALRGARHLRDRHQTRRRAHDGPGRPGPIADHGARRRQRRPATSQQAHRLLRTTGVPRHSRPEPGDADGHGRHSGRRDALRGGLRLGEDRPLRHGRARERCLHPGCGGSDRPQRRWTGRVRPRWEPALRAHPLRQRSGGDRHGQRGRDPEGVPAQPGAAGRGGGEALPLRRGSHQQQR